MLTGDKALLVLPFNQQRRLSPYLSAVPPSNKVYRPGCQEIAIARVIEPISPKLIRLGIVLSVPSSRTNSLLPTNANHHAGSDCTGGGAMPGMKVRYIFSRMPQSVCA
ncbi:hypothetical protein NDI37_26910 [Funiculus sociatus GB2-A5]|uniref:Uncharacterized protein n=1 Tax=Funiculus sociatus GB2-A5 TaxID=2933946 RepID=A0ABV0JZN9_9CYAN|nr:MULTISPECIES: hypothetical protein [unclassified Trichocoleus]MBD1905930.1 hypothetical protein [Trichocoleus sp. FACHB-832]MBD2061183.1 hypothetical protein [Trichocoleus sp. FACHB-6]